MGVPVLILGASGSGKSASLRNFAESEVGIFNVASKPLPFRKKLPLVNKATYGMILAGLTKNNLRCYVIDDSQYLMAFSLFDRAKEVGYTKFVDCAVDFKKLIDHITTKTTDDTIVYLLHHIDKDDAGYIKAKTSGKMLDNQLTLEGLFSIVLLAEVDEKGHWFVTQSNGFTTAKSPMEMFEERIPNDLKAVDKIIRNYYELGGKTE
ncbi:MAG: hypothetical protein IKK97_05985 [Phascolarctobacterium sp.]|nr:hypothetical protein [Phascolarctobacterium sp.]